MNRASRRKARDRTRGAVLVEFGLIAILLFTLLFGIIEFGWAFFQNLDVRHGAREGGRLAAVNYNPTNTSNGDTQAQNLITEICNRMDSGRNVTVTVNHPNGTTIGQVARVQISQPIDQLTGFFGSMLNSRTLRSTVEVRLEQNATWNQRTQTCTT